MEQYAKKAIVPPEKCKNRPGSADGERGKNYQEILEAYEQQARTDGDGLIGKGGGTVTLREIFMKFLEEYLISRGELNLEPEAPNQIYIIMQGKNKNFEGHALFLEEEGLLGET